MNKRDMPKRPSIDIGLAVLDVIRPAGVPLTRKFIAEVCDVTPASIYAIEKRAIRKIQQNIGDLSDFVAEEPMHHNGCINTDSLSEVIA